MWPHLLLIASLLTTSVVFADEARKLAGQMQRAVLVDQNPDQVRALVKEGFDIDAPIGCGTFSALDGAVSKQNPELLELLLSLGAKPRERQLVEAAFAQDHAAGLKMVQLLHRAGVSINARDYYSKQEHAFSTGLVHAVWRENVELVRYLLSEGARPNELSAGEHTPLMVAVEKRNTELFDMLLEAGADPSISNRAGQNALGIADAVIATEQGMRERMMQRMSATASADR